MEQRAGRSCRAWQCEMCGWFMKNAPCCVEQPSNPSVLWATTGLLTGGLWHYWLSKTSLSCWSSSHFSQPHQSTCFCVTPLLIQCSLLGTEFPRTEKCGKSARLRAILFSLSRVQCLLSLGSPLPFCSSIGYTLCLYSAQPGYASAHTHRPQHPPQAHPPALDKAEFAGSWSQKGIFSVEGACSSVNMIKDGFFLGESGCSLSFSLKLASCIQRTIPEQPRVKAGCRAPLVNSPGQARPVVESEFFTRWLSLVLYNQSSLPPPQPSFFLWREERDIFLFTFPSLVFLPWLFLPLHSCPRTEILGRCLSRQ